jgi:2-polyprenyl-3-methyl-5-hydroxy-6-metoxy-1,4-benzoquinol methylase
VPGCCDGEGYGAVFTDRFAKRMARRYRRRGLDAASRRLVDFVCAGGIEGASVLEIGGGVGEIQLELLRRGARRVTNLEISPSYEEEAARLLERAGMTARVERRLVDIAQDPDDVEPADVVVLHRVVCCYPDYAALLTAAGGHAARLLAFSHPPDSVLSRVVVGAENLTRRVRRQSFRAFVHPPDAMVSVLSGTGLTARYRQRAGAWCVVGLER